MDKKLDCAIVRDLLPSYVDQLTGDTTNAALEEHLAGCCDCAEALRLMKAPEAPKPQADPEVDYLKKTRRRSRQTALFWGVGMLAVGILLLFSYVYLFGSEMSGGDGSCYVSVSDNVVSVSGSLSGSGVARVAFEESGGTVTIKIRQAPKAFFNSGAIQARYTAKGPVSTVRWGDLILWENGTAVSPVAGALYAAKHLYAGDMSANGRIASILGIAEQLGPYTNELRTDAEPYGWTLLLETRIAGGDESAARGIMTADACVMLATVGNLGTVTWSYTTDAGPQTYTVTAEDASAAAGGEIKQCAASASELQALVESLRIRLQTRIAP